MGSLAEYPFSPRYFNCKGQRLAYLDEGEGPVLVMVHGNPSWSYLYRRLVQELRGQMRCIVPDHLGCGFSDKPQDGNYRLADHIARLEALLDHCQVMQCVLMVHDWGGAIGMGWAGRHPEKIKGLVVTNTAAFASSRIPLRISVCRWPLLGPLLVRGLNGFARAALTMAVNRALPSAVAQSFIAPYDSWANRIAILRFVQDIPMHAHHPSWSTLQQVEKGLSGLQDKPMLLCWGGKDFCFNDLFYKEWQRRFPQAECHYFAQAGHYLLEDAGDEITALVAAFSQEHGR